MGLKFKASQLNHAKNYKLHDTEYDGYAVTPSDSVDLGNGPTRALYATGAGNINVQLAGGGTAVLTSLSAGQILPIAVTRVLSTSTTATGVYALY